MDTTSLWRAISKTEDNYPALNQDIEVDVAIVGAGITGLTTAHELIKAGKKVAVLEAHRVGSGTTGDSTGNLYVAVQPYYQFIAKKFNFETAKTIANSRKHAIDYIEKNVNEMNIDCNYSRRPWYIFASDDKQLSSLEKEIEIFQKMHFAIDFTAELPFSLKFKKAALMENQARLNPLQYVIGLAAALAKKNGLIYENTKVVDIDEQKTKCLVSTETNKIVAKKVVIATHTPIGIHTAQMFTGPYRSYVVAVRLKDDHYPESHIWDLNEPHHAICTHAVHSEKPELLLVAGSHHKTGQGKKMVSNFKEIEKFLKQHFPVADIEYQWSAQHYQPADDVPYIGLASRFAKHTYIATGYSADGLIYGTLAGKILNNIIQSHPDELANVYKSTRLKPIASSGRFVKENSNVFLQYLKDLPFTDTKSYREIKKGEGKVVEIHGEKCAVTRDEQNQLHIVSAVCTHMKCIVNWNDAEKTWDCPCHGSRFTPEGKVIEGPAIKYLEKKDIT